MSQDDNYPLVHITHENVIGHMISYGAYASWVVYEINGIEFRTLLLNEDFTIIKEIDLGM